MNNDNTSSGYWAVVNAEGAGYSFGAMRGRGGWVANLGFVTPFKSKAEAEAAMVEVGGVDVVWVAK